MSLIDDYDRALTTQPGFPDLARPTNKSLAEICRRFAIPRLPSLLVQLANEAEKYSILFAGLGPDYSAWWNIVYLNERWRTFTLPEDLILITQAEDGICVCLDTTSSDDPDSYRVVVTYLESEPFDGYEVAAPDFAQYLADVVEWYRNEYA